MATHYNYTGGIVTDGLVLHLDAAKRDSYPGSGTTWYDLSGNNNSTVTLTNGPTYTGVSKDAAIEFDGTDDYADFFAPNLTTTTTVEMVAKIGSSYSDDMLFGWKQYDVWCKSGHLGFNTYNSDVYGISSATVSTLGLVNNWKHYVFEMRSDVSYSNNKIYINSISQTLSQQDRTERPSNRNFNSGNGRIATSRQQTHSYLMSMELSSFKVYNRALSADEVQQNFNALRGRYGI